MRELGFVFILITAVCLTKGLAQTPINIIPKPDSIVNKVGSFTFSRTTLISSEITLDRLSEYLSQELQVLTKISPQVNDSPGLKKTDVILLSVDSTFVPPNRRATSLRFPRRKSCSGRGLIQVYLEAFKRFFSFSRLQIPSAKERAIASLAVPSSTIQDLPGAA